MPVDTSSYGIAPIANPMDAFTRAFAGGQESQLRRQAIQQNARQAEEAQRKIAEDDAFKQAIASSAGMSDTDLLEHVRTSAPQAFMTVQKAIDESKAKAATAAESMAKAKEANANAAGHQQAYIGHLADQVDQSDYNPVVFNAALNMAVQQFPEWKSQADQLRQIAATQGKGALKAALQPLIDAGTTKTRADTANTEAELPGKQAASAVQQQVAAGTVVGLTPEQQQQATDRAANTRIAATNAATSAAAQRESARHNAAGEAMQDPMNPKRQEALEQQYRGVLGRTLSSRSGGLGMEDQKVNQAIHLLALMDQGKDQKTGQYNIPKAQFAELASGLATLVSPNGRPTDSMRGEIEQRTAKGDFNGVLTYLTGTPFNGSTQDMYKILRDSIERQGGVAENNREGYFNAIRAQAPTDLEDARRQKLEESLKLNTIGAKKPAAAPTGDRIRVKGPNGETGTMPDGSALPAGWSKVGG